jgi:hypothetical protein
MKTTFLSISIFVVLTFSALNSCWAQCSNLLVNPGAESGLSDWIFSTGTGTDWAIQGSSFGSSSFVASYNWSTKNQTVDLVSLGYAESYLDSEPMVYVQEMFTGHTVNFADEYYFHVELRDSLGGVIASYDAGTQSSPLIADTSWQTVSNTFSSYGPGLRTIYMESGGNDAEFWAGYYGTKMDEAEISFATPVNVGVTNTSPTLTANATGAAYQWLDCDSAYVAIAGATTQVFAPLVNGNYAVEVTENGCVDTSACEAVYNVTVMEAELSKLFHLYPNPTEGSVTVWVPNETKVTASKVRTLSGRVILEKTWESEGQFTLSIEGDAGVYFVELYNQAGLVGVERVLLTK